MHVSIGTRFYVFASNEAGNWRQGSEFLHYDEARKSADKRLKESWDIVALAGVLGKTVEVLRGELNEHTTELLNNNCPGWVIGDVVDVRVLQGWAGHSFTVVQNEIEQPADVPYVATVVADGLEHAAFLLGGTDGKLDGVKLSLPVGEFKDPEGEHIAQWAELSHLGSKVYVKNQLVVPWVGGEKAPYILFGTENVVFLDQLYNL